LGFNLAMILTSITFLEVANVLLAVPALEGEKIFFFKGIYSFRKQYKVRKLYKSEVITPHWESP